MSLIKCSKCEKEISSNADKCIYCGTPTQISKNTKSITNDNEVENNVLKLNIIASIISVVSIIAAVITFIIGLIFIENGGITLIISSILFIILAIFGNIFIKWMALMLQNLYEINMNKRKEH